MAQITVNRAPFLTLWATVVARRLGFREEEALSLAKAFTGLTAQSKAQRLGLSQPRPEFERERVQAEREAKGAEYVEFLDRLIPVIRTEKGLRALSGTSPISPESTRRYLAQKFGENLELVEKKLTELAETFEPMELAGSAMDIYMRIRPKVPEGKAGWGKEGILDLDKIDELITKRRALKEG
jgi:hypothetical protein